MILPPEIISLFEKESSGVTHGVITVAIHVRDGKLVRYVSTREISIIPGRPTSGASGGEK
jgi:hypothetical protein